MALIQKSIRILLIIILLILLPSGGFYFGNKFKNCVSVSKPDLQVEPTKNDSNQVSKIQWAKPETSNMAIPFVKDNTLNLYSITDKQIQPTQYKVTSGGGAYGFGDSDPLASPNGKYIAFINLDDNKNLYIISATGQQTQKITDYPVDYITDWSPDSTKLLFHSPQDDLYIRKQGGEMMIQPPWGTIEQFSVSNSPGFHTFNLDSGIDTYLYPLKTADKFVDSSRVLVELSQSGSMAQANRLVLFNVDTFEADYATVNYEITSFGRQNTFSADGKYWSRTVDNGNTDTGVRITFSEFPDQDGNIVDSGPWASVQMPLLNNTGKYLAYYKKGDQIEQGRWQAKTIIWDTSTSQIVHELSGYHKQWINGNILVVGASEYGNNPSTFTSYSLFDINSNETDTFSVQ